MTPWVHHTPFSQAPLLEAGTHTHRAEWIVGNQEDGYLTGVDSLCEKEEHLS